MHKAVFTDSRILLTLLILSCFLGSVFYTNAHRCSLLLQMSHVAWSVCVPVLDTRVSCAKPAEPIGMPFGELTHVGTRNHVLK